MVKIPNTGYKQSLYWGNESAYGTGATINQSMGLVQSVNPTETNNLIKVRTLGGTRDYSNIVAGKFEVSGSMEYMLQGGAFLRQAIGEDTGSTAVVDAGPKFHTGGVAAGGYVHVMGSAASPMVDDFPSFALEFADSEGETHGTANLHRTFRGCRVNNLSISGSVDEPLRVSADWIAQNVQISTAAASSVTESTDDPYVFYQGVVYSTSGTISYDTSMDSASRLSLVNSFDFSVNNNLEPAWYVCGTTSTQQTLRGLKHLIPKGRDYEASLNLHFEDKTMYERFLGAASATEPQSSLTSYNIVLDFVRSGTIGGVKTATDDYIRILLRDCKFNDINITGAPEDLVSEAISVDVEKAKIFVVDNDSTYR